MRNRKKILSKLSLSKETLRNLDTYKLLQAVGGEGTNRCPTEIGCNSGGRATCGCTNTNACPRDGGSHGCGASVC